VSGYVEGLVADLKAMGATPDVDPPEAGPRRRGFDCHDCGVNTSEIYEDFNVQHDLWALGGLSSNGGKLCVGCLERRIGRRLEPDDFIECLAKYLWSRSRRLHDRMTQRQTPPGGAGPEEEHR
jgi:hypothetical protein